MEIKIWFFYHSLAEPLLRDENSVEVRPEKDIARILQNIPMRSPNPSSCTSGDDSSDHRDLATKPPGGYRRFQNRGIEG